MEVVHRDEVVKWPEFMLSGPYSHFGGPLAQRN